MKFDYVLALLNDNIHGHPQEHQDEVDRVIEILTNGQGYLTKRTKECRYSKVVFFDVQKEHMEMVEARVFDLYDNNAVK